MLGKSLIITLASCIACLAAASTQLNQRAVFTYNTVPDLLIYGNPKNLNGGAVVVLGYTNLFDGYGGIFAATNTTSGVDGDKRISSGVSGWSWDRVNYFSPPASAGPVSGDNWVASGTTNSILPGIGSANEFDATNKVQVGVGSTSPGIVTLYATNSTFPVTIQLDSAGTLTFAYGTTNMLKVNLGSLANFNGSATNFLSAAGYYTNISSSIYPFYIVGSTNAALDGQFIWGSGTTNVLYRSGADLIYTNQAARFRVVGNSGSGNIASANGTFNVFSETTDITIGNSAKSIHFGNTQIFPNSNDIDLGGAGVPFNAIWPTLINFSQTNVLFRSGTDLVYTNGASSDFLRIQSSTGNTWLGVSTAGHANLIADTGDSIYFGANHNFSGDYTMNSAGFLPVGGTKDLGSVANKFGLAYLNSGLSSYSTDAAVTIASTGWTNTFGKNAVVYVDGVGLTFTVYNNAGTAIYTNNTALGGDSILLQPSGKVIITAGSSVNGRATPF